MLNTISPIASQFKALEMSFSLCVSPSTQTRAARLAQDVKNIKPGIYKVGLCLVNHWEGSCTCKTYRTTKKICVHHVAVTLAEHVLSWQPMDKRYFNAAGIEQPKVIAIYARTKLDASHNTKPFKGGFYRVLEVSNGYASIEGANGLHATVKAGALTHVTPFYE